MLSLYSYTAPASPCSYLPEQWASLHYLLVRDLTAREYEGYLLAGWRRFGHSLFQPRCAACRACESLRVIVSQYRPNDSQRRAAKANAGVTLRVGVPSVSREKLELYERFHASQAELVGWTDHGPSSADVYEQLFCQNPFDSEEWCYYLGERLVGVGYVDAVASGLSAIYFYHDPAERRRSLGTTNVVRLIGRANELGLDYVYLGYTVAGCRSLEYKARFRPHEVYRSGAWVVPDNV